MTGASTVPGRPCTGCSGGGRGHTPLSSGAPLQSRAEFLPSRSFIRSGESPVGAFCWKSPKDVDYACINMVWGGLSADLFF